MRLLAAMQVQRAYGCEMQYDIFLADCPARTTLEVIGGSWSVIVITALGEQPRRYTELLDRIGGISRKVLTQVLRRLEHDGLVVRSASTTPRVAHYGLTVLGESALEPVQALVAWPQTHTQQLLEARAAGVVDLERPRAD